MHTTNNVKPNDCLHLGKIDIKHFKVHIVQVKSNSKVKRIKETSYYREKTDRKHGVRKL